MLLHHTALFIQDFRVFGSLLTGLFTCSPVPGRADVPQRDPQVSDGDRGRQRQPVRGAVCQPVHPQHVPAQTGKRKLLWGLDGLIGRWLSIHL